MPIGLVPRVFPTLSRHGTSYQNIITVSQSDDMLIVVYGTRTGYCGFVVHDNEKEIFLQENEGVTTGLDLLEAEWRDYPERLRAILSESKDFLSQGNLQIVSFGVTYRRRHDHERVMVCVGSSIPTGTLGRSI
jgi:hypothetical protein